MINGAGHHIYLDKPEQFNKYVVEACERADAYDPRDHMQGPTEGYNIGTTESGPTS